MKTIMMAATALSLVPISALNSQPMPSGGAPMAAAPAGDINGTWKADIDSVQFGAKPDEFLLEKGTYACKSCTPAYSVAADGAFHAVKLPGTDSDSVKVVDDHTMIETAKKAGRQVGETTMTVSADGQTLSGKFTDSSGPGAAATGEFTETRVGPAPPGSHAISGQWKPVKLSNFNDAGLNFTIMVAGDTLKWSSPTGTSYEAKLGGGDVPIKGDIAKTMVSVTRAADNGYTVTSKREGKVIEVTTFGLGPDGKLHATDENKQNGSTMQWTAVKQP